MFKKQYIYIYYSDNEPKAYGDFINKLITCKPFCDIDCLKLSEKGGYGKISKLIYNKIGLPQIKGVALNICRETSYNASTHSTKFSVCTSIGVCLSRDEILSKIKEHLAKLPQEWKDRRHIPEIYLK